jgi:putative glycosyltransferase (TIGR04372 family)
MRSVRRFARVPFYLIAVPLLAVFRLIRPLLLVRWGELSTDRIGPFAAETELYLCERDAGINVPRGRYVDVFHYRPQIANRQLAAMWKRRLRVWPRWVLQPLQRLNAAIPGGALHEIGRPTGRDRDVHNLFDRLSPHLSFTAAEMERGADGLTRLGIPRDAKFVCMLVRDSAYLNTHSSRDWSYHNYRDSDIASFVPAAEALAARGYFVIRMGAAVHQAMPTSHPRIIDYAANGMRDEFMDIYLGARCHFAISTGSGWDDIPDVFRRPIVYVEFLPFGRLNTFRASDLSLSRLHWCVQEDRMLTLREVFQRGVAFASRSADYETHGIVPVMNTADEIRAVVLEMEERLAGTWHEDPEDDELQTSFRRLYTDALRDTPPGADLHGELRARYGAAFLRENRWWLM